MTTMFNQFRVRTTILEMLQDRGYSTDSYSMRDFDHFCDQFPSCIKDTTNLRIVVHKEEPDGKNKSLLVYFSDEEKMALKHLKLLLENLINEGIKNLIIVLREGISPAAKKFILECGSISITSFVEKNLLFNITHHRLIPKHRIISENEKQKLLKVKMIKESVMPKILISDPVAKYYGAQRGDVVEIERKSETAGKIKTWRITI